MKTVLVMILCFIIANFACTQEKDPILTRQEKLEQIVQEQEVNIDSLAKENSILKQLLKEQKEEVAQIKNQLQLKEAKSEIIHIGGDLNHYYPVFFKDNGWWHGAFTVQICRSSVHNDSVWQGSLISTFTSHSSGWGNGSDFIIANIHNGTHRHIASYHKTYYALGLVVWLRGASTYFYRTNHPTEVISGEEIITYTHEEQKVCEKFKVTDTIDSNIIEGYQYHGRIRSQELQTQDIFLNKDGKDFKIFKTEAGISLQDMTTQKVYKFVLEEVK